MQEKRADERCSARFALRLPRTVYERVKEEAAKEGVSVNYFVGSVLSSYTGQKNQTSQRGKSDLIMEDCKHEWHLICREITTRQINQWDVCTGCGKERWLKTKVKSCGTPGVTVELACEDVNYKKKRGER